MDILMRMIALVAKCAISTAYSCSPIVEKSLIEKAESLGQILPFDHVMRMHDGKMSMEKQHPFPDYA